MSSSRFVVCLLAALGCSSKGTPIAGADASDTVPVDGDTGDAAVAAPDLGPGGDFRGEAAHVAAALHGFYSASTGLWSTAGWWNSANSLTAMVDYAIATGSTTYVADIANTFAHNSSANFLNHFYDDEGWWALAWIRAYDLTHDGRYLAMAKTIFHDMVGGWDSTCGGGIWWNKD